MPSSLLDYILQRFFVSRFVSLGGLGRPVSNSVYCSPSVFLCLHMIVCFTHSLLTLLPGFYSWVGVTIQSDLLTTARRCVTLNLSIPEAIACVHMQTHTHTYRLWAVMELLTLTAQEISSYQCISPSKQIKIACSRLEFGKHWALIVFYPLLTQVVSLIKPVVIRKPSKETCAFGSCHEGERHIHYDRSYLRLGIWTNSYAVQSNLSSKVKKQKLLETWMIRLVVETRAVAASSDQTYRFQLADDKVGKIKRLEIKSTSSRTNMSEMQERPDRSNEGLSLIWLLIYAFEVYFLKKIFVVTRDMAEHDCIVEKHHGTSASQMRNRVL